MGFPVEGDGLLIGGLGGGDVMAADLEGEIFGVDDGEGFVVDGVKSVEAALEGKAGFSGDGTVGFVFDGAADFDTGKVDDENFFGGIAGGGGTPGGVH